MTNDEAQELIALFRDTIFKNNNHYSPIEGDEFWDKQALTRKQINEIITRFANKPPQDGFTVEVESRDSPTGILLDTKRINLKISDGWTAKSFILTVSEHLCEIKFGINKLELQALRNNCNKMLEYLND